MTSQRERILRATIRSIGELGLEQTSIATIRKEAELSTGAIYKHFNSKEEIVAAALQFAAMGQSAVPREWSLLRDDMATLKDERGFDVITVARANLQLLASSLRPGPLRDLLRPQMEQSLSILADRLAAMQDAGEIRLKMNPLRSAKCIASLAEGLTWLGLASGQDFKEMAEDIAAGLECLVEARSTTSDEG